MISKTLYGHVGDSEVYTITVTVGEYKVSVMTRGATLLYFGTDSYNAVLAHKSLEEYVNGKGHVGEVVGPYANRVKNASFTLDGVTYKLDKNDNGVNTLHSGSANYGDKIWSILALGEDSVTLGIKREEEGGWPGDKECEITYHLSSDGVLTLYYKSLSSKKCPVCLTNHAYFVVDDRDCRHALLEVPASSYVDVDPLLIPKEDNPVAVENTPFDFTHPTLIGARRDGKYDNTWVLDEGAVIHLEGNKAEIWCKTTEPGIQIYTGEHLCDDFRPFQGVALETGRFPNTPNRPDFPAVYTDKNTVYESVTSYRLKVKEA